MSLAFLSPVAADGAIARSPMERLAAAAGRRFEVRDGWNVAVDYGGETREPVAWADVSHLRKWSCRCGRPSARASSATRGTGARARPGGAG